MPEYCDQETKEGDYSMRQPFWKLNFGLLVVVLVLLCVALFYKVHLQRPEPITPSEIPAQTISQKIESIDTSKIYKNDLFNTYIGQAAAEPEKPDYVKPVPLPPEPVIVSPPPIEPPQFLDPLPITLTGVFMLNDDTKNRAIILNTKTNEEVTYKIGDEIEDAQLVKIFAQKVLLIRSNGQQEIIYLSQDTATTETKKFTKKDWKSVVKKVGTNQYLLDKQEFVDEIGTLAHFIDNFNLATAYKQGKSIGIKIGRLEETSMAPVFGFNPGDIITKINNMPVLTTDDRLAVYKALGALEEESSVTIELLRNEQPVITTIKLGMITPAQLSISKSDVQKPSLQKEKSEREEQLAILKQREKFAPTLRDIRYKEKENVIRHQRAAESRRHHNKD